MTLQELQQIMPKAAAKAALFLGPLNDAMAEFQINTPQRQTCFLAQIAHESTELTRLEENLRYSPARIMEVFSRHVSSWADADRLSKSPEKLASRVYGGRMGNGDETTGEGYRYRGRGLIQLTGKDNYRLAGSSLRLPLLDKPELLTQPAEACRSAAWFWLTNGCNPLADAGDFMAITKRVNRGTNGYVERCKYLTRAKLALGVQS